MPKLCNTLQHTAAHCSTLQHTATHTLHRTAPQHVMMTRTADGKRFITALSSQMDIVNTATHCNALQQIACNRLQQTATDRAAARDDDAHSGWEALYDGT